MCIIRIAEDNHRIRHFAKIRRFAIHRILRADTAARREFWESVERYCRGMVELEMSGLKRAKQALGQE